MKKYLLIVFAFFLSFVITKYSIDNVFLSQSPRINPFYLVNLKSQVKQIAQSMTLPVKNLANLFKINPASTNTVANNNSNNNGSVPEMIFKNISKGVSAYDKGDGTMVIKIEKGINYKESTIKLPDGNVITVRDFTGE